MPRYTRAELEEALAHTPCENRNMGGRAGAAHNTCTDFAEYLSECGIEWCMPCQVRQEAQQLRITKHEVDIQCQQHFGGTSICRLVQLRHRVGLPNEWQEPRWMCDHCRSLMPGQFRYCDEEQFNLHLALAEGVVR